jgi:hypothetical protein
MAEFTNASTLSRCGDGEPQQLVDRDGFCISCICTCSSSISRHSTAQNTHDHHAILLRCAAWETPNPPTPLPSASNKPAPHAHLHQQRPPFICAQESVLDPLACWEQGRGFSQPRPAAPCTRSDRRAQRGVHPRRLRWGRAARLREAEKVYERFTRERLGGRGEGADTCTPTHARLRCLPGGLVWPVARE